MFIYEERERERGRNTYFKGLPHAIVEDEKPHDLQV